MRSLKHELEQNSFDLSTFIDIINLLVIQRKPKLFISRRTRINLDILDWIIDKFRPGILSNEFNDLDTIFNFTNPHHCRKLINFISPDIWMDIFARDDLVKLILDNNIDVYDSNANTIAHFIGMWSSDKMMEIIIARSNILIDQNIYGQTPIHKIFENGSYENIKQIINLGMVNYTKVIDKYGYTPWYKLFTYHSLSSDILIWGINTVITHNINLFGDDRLFQEILCSVAFTPQMVNYFIDNDVKIEWSSELAELFETRSIKDYNWAKFLIKNDVRFINSVSLKIIDYDLAEFTYRQMPTTECLKLIPKNIRSQIKLFGRSTKPALPNNHADYE
jgi:hypothetical protein